MIGFITTPATSAAITAAIALAQTSRGLPATWVLQGFPVHSGPHTGKHFIPASDEILDCPMRRDDTPRDFPEFDVLAKQLGGLDARIDIDPANVAEK